MRPQHGLLCVSICCLLFVAAGCVAASGQKELKPMLSVEVVAAGQQCSSVAETWSAKWMTSRGELLQHISRCRANRIGEGAGDIPAVDFDSFGVLLLEMGQRKTTGYGFEPDDMTAHIADNTAHVKLGLRSPKPDSAVAQVVTSPWIMLKLPLGDFDNIQILDSTGKSLSRISTH